MHSYLPAANKSNWSHFQPYCIHVCAVGKKRRESYCSYEVTPKKEIVPSLTEIVNSTKMN